MRGIDDIVKQVDKFPWSRLGGFIRGATTLVAAHDATVPVTPYAGTDANFSTPKLTLAKTYRGLLILPSYWDRKNDLEIAVSASVDSPTGGTTITPKVTYNLLKDGEALLTTALTDLDVPIPQVVFPAGVSNNTYIKSGFGLIRGGTLLKDHIAMQVEITNEQSASGALGPIELIVQYTPNFWMHENATRQAREFQP